MSPFSPCHKDKVVQISFGPYTILQDQIKKLKYFLRINCRRGSLSKKTLLFSHQINDQNTPLNIEVFSF